MARQTKTERQRAEEALGVATRARDRLENKASQLQADLKAVERDLAEAERILAYRRQHPALQSTTPTTTEENPTA